VAINPLSRGVLRRGFFVGQDTSKLVFKTRSPFWLLMIEWVPT